MSQTSKSIQKSAKSLRRSLVRRPKFFGISLIWKFPPNAYLSVNVLFLAEGAFNDDVVFVLLGLRELLHRPRANVVPAVQHQREVEILIVLLITNTALHTYILLVKCLSLWVHALGPALAPGLISAWLEISFSWMFIYWKITKGSCSWRRST